MASSGIIQRGRRRVNEQQQKKKKNLSFMTSDVGCQQEYTKLTTATKKKMSSIGIKLPSTMLSSR